MLEFQVGVKDMGVANMLAKAILAIQNGSKATSRQMADILSDEMKYYVPVFSGTLKAALGKYAPEYLTGGSAGEARANSIFKVYRMGDDYLAEVGTTLYYAKWSNYGYTIEEDRVVRFRIGGSQEYRTLKGGTRYPGNFFLEKGVDAARIRYPKVLNDNIRTGLTKAQRVSLSAPSYRPRIRGKFVSRYG